jgi:tRNA1(Val) A37 N6-methylase TrmN6
MAEAPPAVSEDRLLGGRVVLRQPVQGFRSAIDPVLLAAAVPAEPGQTVLELGIGTGAAALCLARRVPGLRVTGLDQQHELVRLAAENAALNGFERQMDFMVGDLLQAPSRLEPNSFDHVMANPPYLVAGTATLPPDAARARAVGEGAADLAAWVGFARAMVRMRGSITFIHRADRLDALLAALSGRVGEIVIFPLWPGSGKPAKRVLVRARRGIETPLKLSAGLVLHEADGKFTAGAERILREGAALSLID